MPGVPDGDAPAWLRNLRRRVDFVPAGAISSGPAGAEPNGGAESLGGEGGDVGGMEASRTLLLPLLAAAAAAVDGAGGPDTRNSLAEVELAAPAASEGDTAGRCEAPGGCELVLAQWVAEGRAGDSTVIVMAGAARRRVLQLGGSGLAGLALATTPSADDLTLTALPPPPIERSNARQRPTAVGRNPSHPPAVSGPLIAYSPVRCISVAVPGSRAHPVGAGGTAS